MLRVINQQAARDQAWDLFVAGNSKKNETWEQFARRSGGEGRTPPPTAATRDDTARLVEDVQRRLGPLYRPPIQA